MDAWGNIGEAWDRLDRVGLLQVALARQPLARKKSSFLHCDLSRLLKLKQDRYLLRADRSHHAIGISAAFHHRSIRPFWARQSQALVEDKRRLLFDRPGCGE
jgi:hypothetical protein